jgi:hypothetical protein
MDHNYYFLTTTNYLFLKLRTEKPSKQKNNKKQNEEKAAGTTCMTETSQQLLEKYSKLVSKKIRFGKSNSWYTLKFNVLIPPRWM